MRTWYKCDKKDNKDQEKRLIFIKLVLIYEFYKQ